MTQNFGRFFDFKKNPHDIFITNVDQVFYFITVLTCTKKRSGATHQSVLRPSDPTVIGSVLKFASEDEDGGEGGNRNVEDELPRVPQAEQVQVA